MFFTFFRKVRLHYIQVYKNNTTLEYIFGKAKINKIIHSPLKNVCWPRDAEDSHDTNLNSKQYHVPLGKNCPKSPRFLLFYDNYPLMSDVLVTFMCSSDWVRRTTELTQLPAAPLADNGATKVSLFAYENDCLPNSLYYIRLQIHSS